MKEKKKLCPCYSGQPYADCCALLHAGVPAADAEKLMRARYSAYALRLPDYILATWHASTRPESLGFDEGPQAKWLGLEVLRHTPGEAGKASVEFVARCRAGGKTHRLHELSRFVCEDGRWLYVDGDVTPPPA